MARNASVAGLSASLGLSSAAGVERRRALVWFIPAPPAPRGGHEVRSARAGRSGAGGRQIWSLDAGLFRDGIGEEICGEAL